jgi:diguanylate cyclase (GGDEF)-like protein
VQRFRLSRLSLLARVSLISLIPIIGLGVVLAREFRDNAREEAIHDARVLAVDVANLRIAPSLSRADLARDAVTPARARRLDRVLGGALQSSDVARAKLWAPDGRVVFSDDRGLEGKRFPVSQDLGEALEGEVTAELTALGEAEQARDRRFGRMVEVYVPLRLNGSRKVAGAFELYVPYAAVSARVDAQQRHTFLVLLAGLAVLWAALLPIVLGASRRLRRQSRENRYQATHDALTGLPNRAAFSERVNRVARHGIGAVAVLNLDRFKEINDTLGHPAGDSLLRLIGPRLEEALGSQATISRLGGDEFALLFLGGEATAQNVLAALEPAFDVDGLHVHVDGSIGVARFPEHGTTAAELLRHADMAMYQAKRAHHGVVTFEPIHDTSDPESLALLGELRRAIEQEELVLHYQPKVDLASREMVGVEALVRWHHPQRGLLPPAAFVPMAEHTALIRPLTLWVLEGAMRQCKRWRDEGRELTVAVNLSVANLLDPSLPGDIAGLLGRTRLPPTALVLEITESVVMTDPGRAGEVLGLLRSMGIAISVDDFGTGHASLAYLQQLPVSELKIDRSFVAAMLRTRGDRAIVASTIDMAHGLDLSVVAEGVEDEPTALLLTDLGCETAQGFHLGRPVPPEKVIFGGAKAAEQLGLGGSRARALTAAG